MKKFNDFILENYTNDDFTFTTNIKADLYSIKNWDKAKYDLSDNDNFDEDSSFTISWKLNLELRDYGVKNIDVEILNVSGSIMVNIWGDEKDTEKEYIFDNNVENFNIVTDLDNITSTIQIQDVEIDFSKKIITINF
ncbi:hypothetical protein M0Q97_10620 [Candidatus Dojkabacteria bacterium]|jgi:hypothetical protein|nr:hypothetical protein [Candidatus Dojkabacteria bacterium]